MHEQALLKGKKLVLVAVLALVASDLGAARPRTSDNEPQARVNLTGAGEGPTGTIRFVVEGELRDISRATRKNPLELEIQNLGTEPFVVSQDDRWEALTVEGEKLLLNAVDFPEVLPRRIGRIGLFLAKKHATAALEAVSYTSPRLPREIVVRDLYRSPEPLLTVPPIIDKSVANVTAPSQVRVGALVAPDGQVREVFHQSGDVKVLDAFRDAALSAVERWRFEPALAGGEAREWLWQGNVRLDGALVPRAEFGLSAEVLAARVSAHLKASYSTVIELPSVGGFIAVEPPVKGAGQPLLRAHLARYGKLAGGNGSWLALSTFERRKLTEAECGCWVALPPTHSATETLERFVETAVLEPRSVTLLALQRDSLVPSGELEPRTLGTWNLAELRAVLERVASNASTAGVLPDEAAFLAAEDVTPASETVLPKLLKRVPPTFPQSEVGSSGSVILQVLLDEKGNVTEVEPWKSAGPQFLWEAVKAVCCWKYQPATIGGKPTSVYFTILVDFNS